MSKLSTEALAYSAAAIQARDFNEALRVRDRELGPDDGAFDDSIVHKMELILSHTPALLADCPPEFVEPLRVAAAMMELWGTNSIDGFVTIDGEVNYRLDAETIARMLHSHARFLRSMESFRAVGVKDVKLVGSGDPDECEACRRVAGSTFTVDSVPELPLVTCQCDRGHGCRLAVVAEDSAG